jgi:hypothetical protein
VQEIQIYTDYKLDESYTPANISVRAGTTFHDIQEVHSMELEEPSGWVTIPLAPANPDPGQPRCVLTDGTQLICHLLRCAPPKPHNNADWLGGDSSTNLPARTVLAVATCAPTSSSWRFFRATKMVATPTYAKYESTAPPSALALALPVQPYDAQPYATSTVDAVRTYAHMRSCLGSI